MHDSISLLSKSPRAHSFAELKNFPQANCIFFHVLYYSWTISYDSQTFIWCGQYLNDIAEYLAIWYISGVLFNKFADCSKILNFNVRNSRMEFSINRAYQQQKSESKCISLFVICLSFFSIFKFVVDATECCCFHFVIQLDRDISVQRLRKLECIIHTAYLVIAFWAS